MKFHRLILTAAFIFLFMFTAGLAAQSTTSTPAKSKTIPLDPAVGRDIANLEAKRNADAANQAIAVLQAERAERVVRESSAAYMDAIAAARKKAGLPDSCRLVENKRWECPDDPPPAPAAVGKKDEPNTNTKPNDKEKK